MRFANFLLLRGFPVIGFVLMLAVSSCGQVGSSETQTQKDMKRFYDFEVLSIDGKPFSLADLKGKKVMVVNTASECGLTPQYESLQELYDAFKDQNFVIIGFPANNFGAQEPGSNEQIAGFCSANYGVTFPMMSKISVKGEDTHPLYQWLCSKDLNGVADHEVLWNFHKFLIDENGQLVRDVHPQTLPTDATIIEWIEQ